MQTLDQEFRAAVYRYREAGGYRRSAPFPEDAVLDFATEVRDYRDRVIMKRPRFLKGLIADLAGQIEFPPKTRQIRVIPAHLLEEIDPSSFLHAQEGLLRNDGHTVLFLNGSAEEISPEAARAKQQVLHASFVALGLAASVTIVTTLFAEKTSIGTIRGIVTDGVLVAAANHGLADPIIISNDVDQIGCSRGYFDVIASHFAVGTLDALTGPIYYGYSPDGEEHSWPGTRIGAPELVLGNRVFAARRALMLLGRLSEGRLFTTEGPSSVFRGAAICAAGGYDYNLTLNEDGMMGNAVFGIRRTARDPHPTEANAAYDYRLWLSTDPRRSLKAISADQCIRNSWRYIPFNDERGHTLDLSSLAAEYRRRDILIQIEDTKVRIDAPVEGKLRERLLKIFYTSLENTFFGNGDLPLYTKYFGLCREGASNSVDLTGEIFLSPELHTAFQRV